ncbi:MAG: hypothetical protein CFE21_12045 [Bacteroidetes bacterium B1(2017)]|nr:MAG: hypothetical protein CFE21_12045 [Bacteroidetes bacterium B1(2017)]
MRVKLFILIFFSSIGLLKCQTNGLSIGDTLPNFSYQGQFAKPYSLKDLKGSYVLVHYWASWNEESRKMQQDFTEPFARYKDRKFKKGRKFYIVSISLDESPKIWDLSLKKDNLPWRSHVCDFMGWNSPIIQKSAIKTIPSNYLLDPNGRIIAKNIKKDELEQLLSGF